MSTLIVSCPIGTQKCYYNKQKKVAHWMYGSFADSIIELKVSDDGSVKCVRNEELFVNEFNKGKWFRCWFTYLLAKLFNKVLRRSMIRKFFLRIGIFILAILQRILQALALLILAAIALNALIYWAITTPLRKIMNLPYRRYSYYFHPLGGDHHETWNPFSKDH